MPEFTQLMYVHISTFASHFINENMQEVKKTKPFGDGM